MHVISCVFINNATCRYRLESFPISGEYSIPEKSKSIRAVQSEANWQRFQLIAAPSARRPPPATAAMVQ
jgi:hypothetical protein